MRGVVLVLWCACSDEPGDTPPADSGTPVDTESSPTDPPTPHEPYVCFADLSVDVLNDGVIDERGFQGFDEAHPTWLMYQDNDANLDGYIESVVRFTRDSTGNALTFDRVGDDPWAWV